MIKSILHNSTELLISFLRKPKTNVYFFIICSMMFHTGILSTIMMFPSERKEYRSEILISLYKVSNQTSIDNQTSRNQTSPHQTSRQWIKKSKLTVPQYAVNPKSQENVNDENAGNVGKVINNEKITTTNDGKSNLSNPNNAIDIDKVSIVEMNSSELGESFSLPYPPASVAMGEQGEVQIKINTTPHLKEVSLVKSTGYQRLDQAALNAVHKYSFPSNKIILLKVQFQLR